MADREKDIRNDEFRVLGSQGPGTAESREQSRRRNLAAAIISAVLVVGIGLLAIISWPKSIPETEDPYNGVFENTLALEETTSAKVMPLGQNADSTKAYTERIDTVINDVQLSILIPHNATPELMVGTPDANDKSIVLIAQAADIRRDNKKILGAFVLKGEPLAWGLSKKGFCGIIDGEMIVGTSENSPLFEEATEKGGYFFRQFALVNNGALVENEIKNKTIRKALCSRAGQHFIAVTVTEESFHDFSQALMDLGVENAIALIGSQYAYGWYVDADGQQTVFGEDVHRYKNENYLLWKL